MVEYHWKHFRDKDFTNWDSNKFDWQFSDYLARNCSEYIKIWWDTERYKMVDYYALIYHCTKYFEIWYDSNVFPWKHYTDLLITQCSEWKHIWEPDYIIWKLTNERE